MWCHRGPGDWEKQGWQIHLKTGSQEDREQKYPLLVKSGPSDILILVWHTLPSNIFTDVLWSCKGGHHRVSRSLEGRTNSADTEEPALLFRADKYTHTFAHLHSHTDTHRYNDTHMGTHMYTHIHTHIGKYTHTCTQVHWHTHTHRHLHTHIGTPCCTHSTHKATWETKITVSAYSRQTWI